MSEQDISTVTEQAEIELFANNDQEAKPTVNEPAKPPNSKQTKIRPRYLPSPPGFFPVPIDIVITMTMQFLTTFTCILVIFASAVIDRDDIGWYIFAQVIFAFIGFGYFTRRINENFLVYDKFYKRLDSCTKNRWQKLKNSDSNFALLWMVLLFVVYWILLILIFPVVMLWSIYQSYKWYQDRRKKVHTEESQRDLEANNNYKTHSINKRVYNIWHLGVLCKNASMISIFIQELPFLIICGIIGNKLGSTIFPIVISIKFIFWIKHCYDIRTMTIFYRSEDFLLHFGMKSIYIDSLTKEITPEYINDYQFELATLQKGDWCMVYVGKEEYIRDVTELTDENSKILWIYKTMNFKKKGKPNLICIEYESVPVERFEDWAAGKAKLELNEIPEDCVHKYDRWDEKLRLTLISDRIWDKYHREMVEKVDIMIEEALSQMEKSDGTQVTDCTNIKNNEGNTYTLINNKDTEVDDEMAMDEDEAKQLKDSAKIIYKEDDDEGYNMK